MTLFPLLDSRLRGNDIGRAIRRYNILPAMFPVPVVRVLFLFLPVRVMIAVPLVFPFIIIRAMILSTIPVFSIMAAAVRSVAVYVMSMMPAMAIIMGAIVVGMVKRISVITIIIGRREIGRPRGAFGQGTPGKQTGSGNGKDFGINGG